jgi:PhnB protein
MGTPQAFAERQGVIMTQRIIPYLTVKGGADAIAFYAKAFGAIEAKRQTADDGKRLMHAVLTINGGTVMLADEFPERGGSPAPTPGKTTPAAVAIMFDSAGEVDETFDRALAAGAKARRSPTDMFWGGRFAVVEDPFGHRWMLAAPFDQSEEGR